MEVIVSNKVLKYSCTSMIDTARNLPRNCSSPVAVIVEITAGWQSQIGCGTYYNRARIISWRFCIYTFWNAMNLDPIVDQ